MYDILRVLCFLLCMFVLYVTVLLPLGVIKDDDNDCERSIVISSCACLSVYVSVCEHISRTKRPIFTKFLRMLWHLWSWLLWLAVLRYVMYFRFTDGIMYANNDQEHATQKAYTQTNPPGSSTEPGAKSDIHGCLVITKHLLSWC